MSDTYRSLAKPQQGDYREKGSKFLAYAIPASDESDLKALLADLKKSHPGARHFCFGAVIGAENAVERSSDAGEPSGTAGLPILNQILSAQLLATAVVVVRYFGGTKLGKPGLIHAYKEAARQALEEAEIVEKVISRKLQIRFPYEDSGVVHQRVERFPGARIVAQEFEELCTLVIEVPKSTCSEAVHLFDLHPSIVVETLE